MVSPLEPMRWPTWEEALVSLSSLTVLAVIRLFLWDNGWWRFAGLVVVLATSLWVLRSNGREGRR